MNRLMIIGLFISILIVGCASTVKLQTINKQDAFELKENLRYKRYGHAAVGFGEYIYVFGGKRKMGYITRVEKYNIKTGKTSILKCRIRPRVYLSAVEHKGKIYIVGGEFGDVGTNRSKATAICEMFDPLTEKITRLPDMPDFRKKIGLVAKDGKLFAVGGSKHKDRIGNGHSHTLHSKLPNDFYRNLFVFNIATQTWTEESEMDEARECNAVVKDNKIYVIGGYNGFASNSIEVYDILLNKWNSVEDAPFKLSANSVVIKDDIIYSFGDYKELNRVLSFNPETKQWNKIISNFDECRHNASVVINNYIYIRWFKALYS